MCSIAGNCSQNILEKEKCAICLGDVCILTTLSSCEHTFCYNCILNWSHVRRTCPVCRRDFINFVCFFPLNSDIKFPTDCTLVYNEASVSVIFPEQQHKIDEYDGNGELVTNYEAYDDRGELLTIDDEEREYYRSFESDDDVEELEEETFEALDDDETYYEEEEDTSRSDDGTYTETETVESNDETYSEAEAVDLNDEIYSERESDDEAYSEFGAHEMSEDSSATADSDFEEPEADDEESSVNFTSNDSYYESGDESSEIDDDDLTASSDHEMSMEYETDDDEMIYEGTFSEW